MKRKTDDNVRLVRAGKKQRKVVENLVHFYVYDFAEVMGWACPDDGMYRGCSDVPGYFSKPRSTAFLIRVGKELAGFVLVDGHPKGEFDYAIGQFFVVRKFRRCGVGSRAAREVFEIFPGRWCVEYLKKNVTAGKFWRDVIDRYTHGRFVETTRQSDWGPKFVASFSNEGAQVTKSAGRRRGAR